MSGWSGGGGAAAEGVGAAAEGVGGAGAVGGGAIAAFGGSGGSFGGPLAGGGFAAVAGGGGAFRAPGGAAAAVAWDSSATGIACARLRDGVAQLELALVALRGAPDLRVQPAPGVDRAALRACAAELDLRAQEAQRLCGELARLEEATLVVGRAYEAASDHVRGAIERLAAPVAHGAGMALRLAIQGALATAPAWAPGALLGAGVAVSAVLAIGLVSVPVAARLAVADPERAAELVARGGDGARDALEQASALWEGLGETLLANPLFRGALAIAVESVDEAVAGFLLVPPLPAGALGERVEDTVVHAALAASAAGATRLFTGSPGRVRAGATRALPAPTGPVGSGGAAMRILRDAEHPVTVRTHRLRDGTLHHEVLVRGTESWGPSAETGLDGLANLENAASVPRSLQGSDAAVVEAMRAAGVQEGDSVDLFGYSQGGAAVANVAATGRFDVRSVQLVGAPVGGTEIPPGVDVLSVAHSGDLVAAGDGMADGSVDTAYLENRGDEGRGAARDHSDADYVTTLDAVDGHDFVIDAHQARRAERMAGAVPIRAVGIEIERSP